MLREREGGIGGGRRQGVEERDREVTVSEVRRSGGTTCLNSCSERRREGERDERGSGDRRKESRRWAMEDSSGGDIITML